MQKLNSLYYLAVILVILAFSSCATQPQATTSSDSRSPLQRDNGNGLASYLH